MKTELLKHRQYIVNRMLDICIELNVEIWNEDQTKAEELHAEWLSLKAHLDGSEEVAIPFTVVLARLFDGVSFSIRMDLDWANAYEDAVQAFGSSYRIISVFPVEHLPFRAEWSDFEVKRNRLRSL